MTVPECPKQTGWLTNPCLKRTPLSPTTVWRLGWAAVEPKMSSWSALQNPGGSACACFCERLLLLRVAASGERTVR